MVGRGHLTDEEGPGETYDWARVGTRFGRMVRMRCMAQSVGNFQDFWGSRWWATAACNGHGMDETSRACKARPCHGGRLQDSRGNKHSKRLPQRDQCGSWRSDCTNAVVATGAVRKMATLRAQSSNNTLLIQVGSGNKELPRYRQTNVPLQRASGRAFPVRGALRMRLALPARPAWALNPASSPGRYLRKLCTELRY